MSGKIEAKIKLNRLSQTYSEGELIAGVLVIEAGHEFRHEGIVVALQGDISMDQIHGTDGSAGGSVLKLIDTVIQIVNPGKIPFGTTDIPFQIKLEGDDGNLFATQTGGSRILETYHGLKIRIGYFLNAEIRRGLLAGNVKADLVEIQVIKPNIDPQEGPKYEFVMTPDTLRKKRKPGSELSISQKSSREISDFLVRGKLDSCIVNLNGALSGLIVVEKSERPIKSLELQLIRMESIAADEIKGPGRNKEISEVQNIQIGDGDVIRNLEIPMFMMFPRKFVCPSIETNIFSIGFELNINVIFADDYLAAENVQLTIVR